MKWCDRSAGTGVGQGTAQSRNRSREPVGQFQCVPHKGGDQCHCDDEEWQEPSKRIAESLPPIGVGLLEQPNPNHQGDGIADKEQDPVDRDLAEDAALDFGIDESFAAFGCRAGHRIVFNSDEGSASKKSSRYAMTRLTSLGTYNTLIGRAGWRKEIDDQSLLSAPILHCSWGNAGIVLTTRPDNRHNLNYVTDCLNDRQHSHETLPICEG